MPRSAEPLVGGILGAPKPAWTATTASGYAWVFSRPAKALQVPAPLGLRPLQAAVSIASSIDSWVFSRSVFVIVAKNAKNSRAGRWVGTRS